MPLGGEAGADCALRPFSNASARASFEAFPATSLLSWACSLATCLAGGAFASAPCFCLLSILAAISGTFGVFPGAGVFGGEASFLGLAGGGDVGGDGDFLPAFGEPISNLCGDALGGCDFALARGDVLILGPEAGGSGGGGGDGADGAGCAFGGDGCGDGADCLAFAFGGDSGGCGDFAFGLGLMIALP